MFKLVSCLGFNVYAIRADQPRRPLYPHRSYLLPATDRDNVENSDAAAKENLDLVSHGDGTGMHSMLYRSGQVTQLENPRHCIRIRHCSYLGCHGVRYADV